MVDISVHAAEGGIEQVGNLVVAVHQSPHATALSLDELVQKHVVDHRQVVVFGLLESRWHDKVARAVLPPARFVVRSHHERNGGDVQAKRNGQRDCLQRNDEVTRIRHERRLHGNGRCLRLRRSRGPDFLRRQRPVGVLPSLAPVQDKLLGIVGHNEQFRHVRRRFVLARRNEEACSVVHSEAAAPLHVRILRSGVDERLEWP
mmetsp:Transcript_6357/g.16501  ORF Transcript_6357/g.16501 Transcript_6357/m.16501 type:complete len:203 (-) Transcript_6357:474-1082(-)